MASADRVATQRIARSTINEAQEQKCNSANPGVNAWASGKRASSWRKKNASDMKSLSAKHFDHLLDRITKHIHFFTRVIKRKRSARRGRDIQPLHHWLGTVMSGADGDTFLIQDGANVVGMDAVNYKREYAHLLPSGADNADTLDF